MPHNGNSNVNAEYDGTGAIKVGREVVIQSIYDIDEGALLQRLGLSS
jgi:hypothetical protein